MTTVPGSSSKYPEVDLKDRLKKLTKEELN